MQVTISPKYQIVIPKEARERLGWKPGQKIEVLTFGNQIRLVAVRPIEEMRGFLKGIDTNVPREGDRV